MTSKRFFADNTELQVAKRIGKGGEGEVFAVTNMPGFALKVYLPTVVSERETKIRAMVASGLLSSASNIAFPHRVVVDERQKFAGFLMRLVEKHKEIHELQTPASRLRHFPNADFRFVVRTALNVARVFSQVHGANCVVGDINQRSILVSETATVALIDADSFQFSLGTQKFPCVVGVPDYTPPELQGKSLRNVDRTVDHDAFGLAVSIFQLLCMDRHPFSGKYQGHGDMTMEKAIEQYRYVYSTRPTGMKPPPGAIGIGTFPSAIREGFEEAFSPLFLGRRPSSARWVKALEALEASLKACNSNSAHFYPAAAPSCPWCKMEADLGTAIFVDLKSIPRGLGTGRTAASPTGYVIDIAAIKANITALNIPTRISFSFPSIPPAASPSPEAIQLKNSWAKEPVMKRGGAFLLILAVCMFALGKGFLPVAFVVGGIGIYMLAAFNKKGSGDLTRRFSDLSSSIVSAISEYQRRINLDPLVSSHNIIIYSLQEYQKLCNEYQNVEPEYIKDLKDNHLKNYMNGQLIRGAAIDKLSSKDRAALSSYGISTAQDAKKRDLQSVPGIGPVKAKNILSWVWKAEAAFKFNSNLTPDDRLKIHQQQASIVKKQKNISDIVATNLSTLRNEVQKLNGNILPPDNIGLSQSIESLGQMIVDMRHLGMQVPAFPVAQPREVSGLVPLANLSNQNRFMAAAVSTPAQASVQARPQQTASAVPNCPSCGKRMVLRTARRGSHGGRQFWGCSQYPRCTGTRNF